MVGGTGIGGIGVGGTGAGGTGETAEIWLKISIANQRATLMRDAAPLRGWPVSTAKNGAGEQNNSGCTPRGWHRIRAKIGGDEPPAAVFIGRRPTGEVHGPELHESSAGRDWILSRILWLCGEEVGKNQKMVKRSRISSTTENVLQNNDKM